MDKRIITHKWGNNPTNDEYTSSNGYIISSDTYDKSFAFFKKLAAEAQKDFPFLTEDEIECFVVTKSRHNEGFGGVRFSLPENAKKKGYSEHSTLNFYHT